LGGKILSKRHGGPFQTMIVSIRVIAVQLKVLGARN
jgi:hypothetical protein